MPVKTKTEEVTRTETKVTKRYICDAEGCEASVEGWNPRGDPDVASPNADPGHNLNYVALNPYPRTSYSVPATSGGTSRNMCQLEEEDGVFVCDDHIEEAGRLLAERMEESDD